MSKKRDNAISGCTGTNRSGFCFCGCERHYSPIILANLGKEVEPLQTPWIPGPEELAAFRSDLRDE